MKTIGKLLLALTLTLCMLAVPFCSVLAEGELDLMPTADDGYTIVEGDGTVTIADGVMTLVNNGDGDLRVTIDNTTSFDMSTLNGLQMQFNAEMPFKMAYHIISDADNTNDWLSTTNDYADIYEIDYAADRSPAGEYDVKMNLGDLAVAVTDQSAVHFDQFIILVTGKGSFTLNTVKMITVESEATTDEPADSDSTTDEPADDDTAADEPADDDTATTVEPAEDDTTTTKATASDKDDADADKSSNNAWLLIAIAVVVVIVIVAVIVIVKKRKA